MLPGEEGEKWRFWWRLWVAVAWLMDVAGWRPGLKPMLLCLGLAGLLASALVLQASVQAHAGVHDRCPFTLRFLT